MLKLLNIYFGLIFCFTISCNAQVSTSDKYKYVSSVSTNIYKRNIKDITDSITALILNKADPYYQSENDSSTEIFVDTILYSPQKNKFAFFVITKNSNYKLLEKGDQKQFHFNANCFIGRLDTSFNIIDFVNEEGNSLFNFKTYKSASEAIRELYFNEITKRRNKNGESTYKFNFDDVRFWNGPLWNKYYK